MVGESFCIKYIMSVYVKIIIIDLKILFQYSYIELNLNH